MITSKDQNQFEEQHLIQGCSFFLEDVPFYSPGEKPLTREETLTNEALNNLIIKLQEGNYTCTPKEAMEDVMENMPMTMRRRLYPLYEERYGKYELKLVKRQKFAIPRKEFDQYVYIQFMTENILRIQMLRLYLKIRQQYKDHSSIIRDFNFTKNERYNLYPKMKEIGWVKENECGEPYLVSQKNILKDSKVFVTSKKVNMNNENLDSDNKLRRYILSIVESSAVHGKIHIKAKEIKKTDPLNSLVLKKAGILEPSEEVTLSEKKEIKYKTINLSRKYYCTVLSANRNDKEFGGIEAGRMPCLKSISNWLKEPIGDGNIRTNIKEYVGEGQYRQKMIIHVNQMHIRRDSYSEIKNHLLSVQSLYTADKLNPNKRNIAQNPLVLPKGIVGTRNLKIRKEIKNPVLRKKKSKFSPIGEFKTYEDLVKRSRWVQAADGFYYIAPENISPLFSTKAYGSIPGYLKKKEFYSCFVEEYCKMNEDLHLYWQKKAGIEIWMLRYKSDLIKGYPAFKLSNKPQIKKLKRIDNLDGGLVCESGIFNKYIDSESSYNKRLFKFKSDLKKKEPKKKD